MRADGSADFPESDESVPNAKRALGVLLTLMSAGIAQPNAASRLPFPAPHPDAPRGGGEATPFT